jgi:uncharacterized membrane protein
MRDDVPHPRGSHTLGFERFIFFSDAVFAIAITLLVLDLKPLVNAHGALDLAALAPSFLGFGVSFYVIGRYWLAHHGLMETIQAYDRRLLAVNLAFLAGIAFTPFATTVVAALSTRSGGQPFYALSMAAVGALMALLTLAARRPGLMRPGETHGGTARLVVGSLASPLVFVLTAAVAAVHPGKAMLLILLLVPMGWVTDWLGGRLARRIDAPKAEAA